MTKKVKRNKQKITRDSTAYTKDEWFGSGKRSRKRRIKPTKAPNRGNNGTGGIQNIIGLAIDNTNNVSNLDISDTNSYLSQ